MDVRNIIAEIDAEIAKLQGVRATLSGLSGSTYASTPVKTGRRGRPKGSKNAPKSGASAETKPKSARKRQLSAEGRKRIADAMKKRWADRRKASAN